MGFLFGCVVFFFILFFSLFVCFLDNNISNWDPIFSAFENVEEAKAPPKDLKVLNLYFVCNL